MSSSGAAWKNLNQLLALSSTKNEEHPFEASLFDLRSKGIVLPLLLPPQSSSLSLENTPTPSKQSASCRLCKIDSFPGGVQEQRAHFKSTWHALNLTQVEKGKPVLSAKEAELFDEEEEDTYQSTSSSSEEDEDEQKEKAIEPLEESSSKTRIWPLDQTQTNFKLVMKLRLPISKPVFQSLLHPSNPVCWGVILYRSGHLACVIVLNGKVIQHKTEHRYTTRKKQGGSQASHDTRSGKAKSAGAQLRRYGEQTMRERIAKILLEWDFSPCSLVFFALPERARALFFSKTQEGNKFLKSDPRCVKISFMTQRPTLEECERVVSLYSRIEIFPAEEATTAVALPPAQVSEEENGRRVETVEEIEARKAQKEEKRNIERGLYNRPIHLYCLAGEEGGELSDEVVSEDLNTRNSLGETALHIAADQGNLALVQCLLFDYHANVSIKDFFGKTAYQRSKEAPIRYLFREYRQQFESQLQEDEGYWQTSQIPLLPPAKTEQEVEAKKAKEREKKKRQVQRKREEKTKAEEEAKARALLPPEAPHCRTCWKLFTLCSKKDMCSQGPYSFCSSQCMRMHSRKLAAEALDRRLQ